MQNLKIALSLLASLGPTGAARAQTTWELSIKGKDAESISRALIISQFEVEVKNGQRTLKIDELVTRMSFGHACDVPENVLCGFREPTSLHAAKQNGKSMTMTEIEQLAVVFERTVDPILKVKASPFPEGAAGTFFRDYGSILCTWKVSAEAPHKVENAQCDFKSLP